MQPSNPPRPAWSFVLLLAAMSSVGPLSIDMCLPSLLTIEGDLRSAAGTGSSIISVFFVGIALGQLLYGPASDRYGRRAPVLLGYGLYAIGSIACAVAPTLHALLGARAVQALGGCASMVIARAIVGDRFAHRESARMFSLLGLIAGAAPILAPLIGSLLLNVLGWRSIFVVLAVFGGSVGVAILFKLPESRSEEARRRARQEHPLRAYRALFANRRLVGYLLAGALNSAAIFTYIASSSNVLIGAYGLSPGEFGIAFAANAGGLIVAGYLNRLLLRRYSPDRILAGAALASVLFAATLVARALSGVGGLGGLLLPLFCTIASSSLIQANTLAGALAVDANRVGSAAALFGAGGFAAGAVASSIAGALTDGTERPMVCVIAASLLGCAAALYGLALPAAAVGPRELR